MFLLATVGVCHAYAAMWKRPLAGATARGELPRGLADPRARRLLAGEFQDGALPAFRFMGGGAPQNKTPGGYRIDVTTKVRCVT